MAGRDGAGPPHHIEGRNSTYCAVEYARAPLATLIICTCTAFYFEGQPTSVNNSCVNNWHYHNECLETTKELDCLAKEFINLTKCL